MRSVQDIYVKYPEKTTLQKAIYDNREWNRSLDMGHDYPRDGKQLILKNLDLARVDFESLDLTNATFKDCNLENCDFSRAILTRALMINCNLSETSFAFANLTGTDFTNSNLNGANFTGAYITAETDFTDVSVDENTTGYHLVCPEEGSFIAWKKARSYAGRYTRRTDVVIKLEIPADAKRSSATTRKCRASYAKVLDIQYVDGTKYEEEYAVSKHDSEFEYAIGDIVRPDDFDENRWDECSNGIHFFMTRQEAVRY